MGYLDSFWRRDDPLKDLDLDPNLRKYLEEQAPKGYRTASERAAAEAKKLQQSSSSSTDDTYRSRLGLNTHNDPDAQDRQLKNPAPAPPPPSTTPPVPPQSLYPDGRYADLWKTYRPPSELAQAGKSDQEKLLDVVGGYKERQAQVSRASLENCADFQFALSECFRTGGWKSRMSMCRAENQSLSRCMEMQGKLLRALGYLSLDERSEEQGERLQMHADRLYHEMLERERRVKEAREQGVPEPTFAPLLKGFDASRPVEGAEVEAALMTTAAERVQRGEGVTYESLPEQMKLKLSHGRLKDKTGDELELAKLELEQDLAVKMDLVRKLNERYIEEKRERDVRYQAGEERFGDKVKRWFDFRKYPTEETSGK